MKKLKIVLLAVIVSLCISFTSANLLTDIINSISPRKTTNTFKKNILWKTLSLSSDNTTWNIIACLWCGGSNIITSLMDESGNAYYDTGDSVVQYTVGSPGYTPANGWSFNDSTFWATNPSDDTIIDKYFGTNSAYTDLWSGTINTCVTWSISVVDVAVWWLAGTTPTDNTIYLLASWTHILTAKKKISASCVAFISKWNAKIVWSTTINLFERRRNESNIIFDNISIDWTDDWAGWTHTEVNKCLSLNPFFWPIQNISINNVDIDNCKYWIYAVSSSSNRLLNYISLTNNNISNWRSSIYFWWTTIWNQDHWNIYNNTMENNIWVWYNSTVFFHWWKVENWNFKYNILSWNNLALSWTYLSSFIIDSNLFCNNTSDGITGTNYLGCSDVIPWGSITYTKYNESVQFNSIVDAGWKSYITGYTDTMRSSVTWYVATELLNYVALTWDDDIYGIKTFKNNTNIEWVLDVSKDLNVSNWWVITVDEINEAISSNWVSIEWVILDSNKVSTKYISSQIGNWLKFKNSVWVTLINFAESWKSTLAITWDVEIWSTDYFYRWVPETNWTWRMWLSWTSLCRRIYTGWSYNLWSCDISI